MRKLTERQSAGSRLKLICVDAFIKRQSINRSKSSWRSSSPPLAKLSLKQSWGTVGKLDHVKIPDNPKSVSWGLLITQTSQSLSKGRCWHRLSSTPVQMNHERCHAGWFHSRRRSRSWVVIGEGMGSPKTGSGPSKSLEKMSCIKTAIETYRNHKSIWKVTISCFIKESSLTSYCSHVCTLKGMPASCKTVLSYSNQVCEGFTAHRMSLPSEMRVTLGIANFDQLTCHNKKDLLWSHHFDQLTKHTVSKQTWGNHRSLEGPSKFALATFMLQCPDQTVLIRLQKVPESNAETK